MRHARRSFLLGSMAALPVLSWLGGCADQAAGADSESASSTDLPSAEHQAHGHAADAGAHEHTGETSAHERAHLLQLTRARASAANRHDLERLMAGYASGAELVINGERITDPRAIRESLAHLGFARAGASLSRAKLSAERTVFTDQEVLVYGRLTGSHVGVLAGFSPTGREVTLEVAAFYRFNPASQLVSERLTVNFGMLNPSLVLPSG